MRLFNVTFLITFYAFLFHFYEQSETIQLVLILQVQVGPPLYKYIYILYIDISFLTSRPSALPLPKGRCVSDEGDVELGRYRGGGFGGDLVQVFLGASLFIHLPPPGQSADAANNKQKKKKFKVLWRKYPDCVCVVVTKSP